jgi:hypothetical protein
MRRHLSTGALLLFLSACGDDLDAYLVLTSEHFRVVVYPGAKVPASPLELLEAHYRDSRAYLSFSEAKIEYHLLPSEEAARNLCTPGPAGTPVACAKGSSVYSVNLPDEHELIHVYLASLGSPPSIIQEGVAQGISCRRKFVREGLRPPWRTPSRFCRHEHSAPDSDPVRGAASA